MAQVVKPGRVQAGWSKEYKCTGAGNGDGGCGAIILVSGYDIYETSSSCMGESEKYATFCCPACGMETDIKFPPGDNLKGKRPSPKKRKAIAMANLKRKS